MVLALLIISSTVLIFSNPTVPIAKATIPANMLQYEWRQAAQDSSRSFFNPGPGPTTPHIEWRAEIPNLITQTQPVAFNGMIFVKDALGSTYALDAATGDIVYKLTGTSGNVAKIDDTYMLIGSKCYKIADGSLVWTGPSGFSQSQDQRSGVGYTAELKIVFSGSRAWSLDDPSQPPTVLWNRATESDYGAYGGESVRAYGNGVIVYNTAYNYLRGVDALTGKTLWTTATTCTDWIYADSVIDGVFGRGDLDGNFRGWNITTGELIWTFNAGTFYNEYSFSATSAYGMFYELNEDKNLYAINATTGEKVWSYEGPGVAYQGVPIIADGKIYALTGENQFRDFATGEFGHSEYACLDAYTGEVIWTEPFECGSPFTLHCIAYGKLYCYPSRSAYSSGEYVYTFDQGTLNEVWCIGDTPQDWPMFLGDPENSGFGDGPTNLALKWNVTVGGVVSSPTLVNGVAYVGAWDGYIYAFDANTGAYKWSYDTGKIGFMSTPAVVNGKLYTGADDGKVYCLNAATGAKLWEANAGGVPTRAPAIFSTIGAGSPTVVGDRVYVAAANSLLYCFNTLNGAVIWTYNATGDIQVMTPTVVDGAVYFGANGVFMVEAGPHVIKLNATTGAEMFNVVIPGFFGGSNFFPNILASVTVGGGMVFARANFRYNYALNATTGATIWFVDSRYNPGTPSQAQGNQQSAPLLYKYGTVYMTDFYGVTALNALNGSELWHTYLSRENNSPGMAYSYGRVYTVTEAGALYVLDSLSGEKLSYYQLGGTTLKSVPTPYNGSLYLGSRDWNFYCFEEGPEQEFHGDFLPTSTSVDVAPKNTLSETIVLKGQVLAQSNDMQTGIPVPVLLRVLDPNNNYHDISVTCNERGFYSATWTPPISGYYTVTAMFEGDDFFLPSTGDTAFMVSEEAVITQGPQGDQGPQGATGPTGQTGPQGAMGPPGQAGTTAAADNTPLIIAGVSIVGAIVAIGIAVFTWVKKRG